MAQKVNRGKQFENIIKEAFERVPDVSVVRLHDQTTGYLGSSNHCDFIVYKKPYEYHIECKSVHGNTFPFSNITDNQYKGLLEKSKIQGVFAGLIVWWVDKDVTAFVPIQFIEWQKTLGRKSLPYGLADGVEFENWISCITIPGKKKRVFFDYDMDYFFHTIEKSNRREV